MNFISALSFFVNMAKLAVKRRKKNQGFFQVTGVYWWVVVLGLGWWWVDERGKIERRRTEMKREEREIFYIILFCNLYYFNIL